MSDSDLLLAKPRLDLNLLPTTPLFGTDGIRSQAGELLNAPFVLQLGYWTGRVLQGHSDRSGAVIIGQDSRNSSDMLAMAIGAGLMASGLEVWHIGLCPTPCVAALTGMSEALGGIMISASHNPPEDNGIKFFDFRGTKLADDLTDEIELHLRSAYNLEGGLGAVASVGKWGKHYNRHSLVRDYLGLLDASLPANINFKQKKIVLDLAWGASVEIAPEIFRQLGAEVITLHSIPDGDKINVNCGSTHLKLLQAAVIEHNADLGFAFDGDADRVMAVDSRGRVVDGDYILYLWGNYLKTQEQLPDNSIVTTVMANLGFERAWQKLGGQLRRTPVGDRYVQAEMWRTGAMLGGEQSGHILCHHHSVCGDGIQTALHLSALVAQSGISLTELIDNSFQTYPQLLRNVKVEDPERRCQWEQCEPLQREILRAEQAMGDRGRILVRASGTEPVVRVMVEAEDLELTHYWTDNLVKIVEQYLAA